MLKLLLLACAANAFTRIASQKPKAALFGLREQYEAKAAEREKNPGVITQEAQENAAARLKAEFEAYKRTTKYAGESLESFKERRDAVSAVPAQPWRRPRLRPAGPPWQNRSAPPRARRRSPAPSKTGRRGRSKRTR